MLSSRPGFVFKRLLGMFPRATNHMVPKTLLHSTSTSSALNDSLDIKKFWGGLRPHQHQPTIASNLPSKLDQQGLKDLQETITTIISRSKNKGGATVVETQVQYCCDLYEALDNGGRQQFLELLAHEFGVPKGLDVQESTQQFIQDSSIEAAQKLRDQLTPRYMEFFDQIHRLASGFPLLVHMRALSNTLANQTDSAGPMRAMSRMLMGKLKNMVIGSLDFQRMTWDSPAYTIEKLGELESVHSFKSLLDVKRRLGIGRRCFGFFHRSVPTEPLSSLSVALTGEISTSVQDILLEPEPRSVEAEKEARSAMFYSINSHPGLAAVDLGNTLIKRAVKELQTELPNIKTFCTLSPIPQFRHWLEQWLTPQCLSDPPTCEFVGIDEHSKQQLMEIRNASTWTRALKQIIDSRGWTKDPRTMVAMRPVVLGLAGHYLVNVKRTKGVFDPVGNFHLRNGACLRQINWRGDSSYKGLRQSLGLMCNYEYVLERVDENHREYLASGKVAVSGEDMYIGEAMKRRHLYLESKL